MRATVYADDEANPDPEEKTSVLNETEVGGELKYFKVSLAMSFFISSVRLVASRVV